MLLLMIILIKDDIVIDDNIDKEWGCYVRDKGAATWNNLRLKLAAQG